MSNFGPFFPNALFIESDDFRDAFEAGLASSFAGPFWPFLPGDAPYVPT